MKYALLSDPHGNLPALDAALADAAANGADAYILLGDYVEDFPWPNEIVDRLRSLENAYIICGNKEGYLREMALEDQSGWIYEQMAPMYRSFRALTEENRAYLMSLPGTIKIPIREEKGIRLDHSVSALPGIRERGLMRSSRFMAWTKETGLGRERYQELIRQELAADHEIMAAIRALPQGIYCFGHCHLQWHGDFEGRLLVNPGSCGLPLDGDVDSPYTMLEGCGREWIVTERRVPYNREAVASNIRALELYGEAPAWCDMIISALYDGLDHIAEFFHFAREYSRARELERWPYPDEQWHEMYEQWKKEKQ